MIHGLDTGFLVSAELVEHPDHVAARATPLECGGLPPLFRR